MKPSKSLRLDLFTDADFAGLYTAEDVTDAVSMKSRSGWIINFGEVPTFLDSKLLLETVLSTMEAQ